MAKIKATSKSKGYFAIDSESKAHLLAHTNKHIHTHTHTNTHIQNRIYVNKFEIFYSLSIKTSLQGKHTFLKAKLFNN